MPSAAHVYWIHLPKHHNPFSQGYIGVSKEPENRMMEHRRQLLIESPACPILAKAMKDSHLILDVLVTGSEIYCYDIESELRPTSRIGWNLAPGGYRPPTQYWGKRSKEYCLKLSKLMSDGRCKKTSEHKQNHSLLMKEKFKNPEYIKRHSEINSKPVVIEGKAYGRALDAAEEWNMTPQAVFYRLRSPNFSNWRYY